MPVTKSTYSTVDGVVIVNENPVELADKAGVPIDTYSMARCIASEGYSGPAGERAAAAVAIGQVCLNEAKRRDTTVTKLLLRSNREMASGSYGEQKGRWASTRKDPCKWHLDVAKAVVAKQVPDLIGSASMFFDPKTQDSGKQGTHSLQSADKIITTWTNEDKKAWIGPVKGLSSYNLMFLKSEPDAAKREKALSAALAAINAGRMGRNTYGGAGIFGIGFWTLALAGFGGVATFSLLKAKFKRG